MIELANKNWELFRQIHNCCSYGTVFWVEIVRENNFSNGIVDEKVEMW